MELIKEAIRFAKLAQKYQTLNELVDWVSEQESLIRKQDMLDFIKKQSEKEL